MKKKSKLLIYSSFIVLDILLFTGFLIVRDATSYNNLEKEMKKLEELDITSDRYNRKIRSSGGYAVVEKSIKGYFDTFAVGIEEITDIVSDDKFTKVLSYDNYLEDGPLFEDSISYVSESRDKFNDKIDKMIEMTNSKYIDKNISGKTSNDYYISLYTGYMNNNKFLLQLHQLKELLKKTKIRVNNTYDVSYDVLNFLKVYKDEWELEDGEIKFRTDELYNYYTSLISKIDKKDE